MGRLRGFTLLELLVVMSIMGILGTLAMGGYHSMVRGMETRGVMQNVNAFIAAAHQRAQIDRRPIVLYFWNEPVRAETEDRLGQATGRAVAVRPWGRISRLTGNGGSGSRLVDEFVELNRLFDTNTVSGEATMALYALDGLASGGLTTGRHRSFVALQVVEDYDYPNFLKSAASSSSGEGREIPGYAYQVVDANGVSWKRGMLYGMEFQELQLPNGYIFGSSFSGTRVKDIASFVLRPGQDFTDSLEVSNLRQDGASLAARAVGKSEPQKLNGGS